MSRAKAAARLRWLADISALRFGRVESDVTAEAIGLAAAYLGADNGLVQQLKDLPPNHHIMPLGSGVGGQFPGLARAAATLIESDDGVPRHPACDRELWDDIGGLVEAAQWHVIPGRVVTFVESWLREAGGNPVTKKGGKAYGVVMMQEILHPDGPYALGNSDAERKGWRDLGVGLVAAIGNDHRHDTRPRLQEEQAAWGVIGTASLLIGEFRRTHESDGSGGTSA